MQKTYVFRGSEGYPGQGCNHEFGIIFSGSGTKTAHPASHESLFFVVPIANVYLYDA
jgi:hypothetical protein